MAPEGDKLSGETEPRERLRAALADRSLDAVLLVTESNIAYATAYHQEQHERFYALLMKRDGQAKLLVPGLEEPEARKAVEGREIEVASWQDGQGYEAAFRELMAEVEGGWVGIERSKLPVAVYELAKEGAPSARFTACEELIDHLRARKTASEIRAIAAAAAAAQLVMDKVPDHVHEGMTEREACEVVRGLMLAEEVQGLSFGPFVIAGDHSAFPQAHPSSRKLGRGEPVLIDFGAKVDGYCSDIARTFVVGAASKRHMELDEIVRSAQAAAIDACIPGRAVAEIDRAARGVLADAGVADHFPHRTGHGVGLEFHETPNVHGGNEEPIDIGMVLAIEPGVYFADYGAVRTEDNIVVTAEGPLLLTKLADTVSTLA